MEIPGTSVLFIIEQQNKVGKEVLICLGPEMSIYIYTALPNCLLIMSMKYVSYGAQLSIKLGAESFPSW